MTEHLLTRAAWRDAIKASDLSTPAKFAALIMAEFWNHEEVNPMLWCSNDTIARDTSMSRATVKRARRELQDGGWLVLSEASRAQRSARFLPSLPRWREGAQSEPPPGSDSTPRGITEHPESLVTPYPSTPLEPSASTTRERHVKSIDASTDPMPVEPRRRPVTVPSKPMRSRAWDPRSTSDHGCVRGWLPASDGTRGTTRCHCNPERN